MISSGVLLVDDDPDDVEVALRAARREKLCVEITVFHDGREALEALGIDGATPVRLTPRAVFLDLRMPRLDGWEVLRRLRANPGTKELPVIVLSWSSQCEDIERCYALGANSFVVKRFTPSNPGSYFTDAVRYWIQLNQTPGSIARST